MKMVNFRSFTGYVTNIGDFPIYSNSESEGCQKLITLEDKTGAVVHFIASPDTYFHRYRKIAVGDIVTGYYDGDRPVILIYPPQYQALIIVKETPYEQVKVDYFNESLISSDGQLQLLINAHTPIFLTNNQPFLKSPANKNLIVSYGPTTKSIPAQTDPYEIIVYCRTTN